MTRRNIIKCIFIMPFIAFVKRTFAVNIVSNKSPSFVNNIFRKEEFVNKSSKTPVSLMFDNLDLALNDSRLRDGVVIKIKGRYTGIEGGSKWFVVDSNLVQHDGNAIVVSKVNPSLALCVIPDDGLFVDLESLGADSHGNRDSGPALQSALDNGLNIRTKKGLYVIEGSCKSASSEGEFSWHADKSIIKLSPGFKSSALLVLNGYEKIEIKGVTWHGNRHNTSGNNASFLAVKNCKNFIAIDTSMIELLRYGYSVTGGETAVISNLLCDNIGMQVDGKNTYNGEAIKFEFVKNVNIEGFKLQNTSGTGDGQVIKCFYCGMVRLNKIHITDASPSCFYPSISNVRNNFYSISNALIDGRSKVALEDNANLHAHYKNIKTKTNKALLLGTNGGSGSARSSIGVLMEGWIDYSSSNNFSFNILGCQSLRMKSLTTDGSINISRDGVTSDRRCENLSLYNVKCKDLYTLLCKKDLFINDVIVTGTWTNSSETLAVVHNSRFSIYSKGRNEKVKTFMKNTVIGEK